jgi:hypothetical protein
LAFFILGRDLIKSVKKIGTEGKVADSLGLKLIDEIIVGDLDGFRIYVGILIHGVGNARETITTFSAGIQKSFPEGLYNGVLELKALAI